MGHTLLPLPNFAGGELSPLLDARIDMPAYLKGGRQVRNLVVLKSGGVTRRPGLQYIAMGKGDAAGTTVAPAVSRLKKFQFSPGTTFQLEFCHNAIRFFSNGAAVTLSSAPAWVSGTSYPAGSFVSNAGQIWYTPIVIINSTVAPSTLTTPFILQAQLEVPAPYSALNYTGTNYWAADVFVLQCCQINDVVYIVHPNFPVYKLTRYSDTNWKMEEVGFLTPPLLDQNATDTTIAASATTGTGITLTATAPAWAGATYYQPGNSVLQGGVIYRCLVPHTSGTFTTDLANGDWQATPIFNALHIGSYWQLAHNPPAASQLLDEQIDSDHTSGTINVIGTWTLITYGTWTATLAIQASYDNGNTWQTVTTLTSTDDANFNIQGQSVVPALYRIDITGWSSSTSTTPPRVTLTPDNQFVYGLVQITAVANDYSATANVVTPLYSTNATVFWSEGAWSDYRGYPQAVAVFQERVWYGATTFQPQRIWATQTNDLENFALLDQSQATYGLVFDLNAPGRGAIQWLNAQTDLMAGLSGAEWIITSGAQDQAITATQVIALEHSANGSAPNIVGQIVGNAAFYVQRRGTTVQQMLFSVFTSKYMSQDMIVLSDHLTRTGIKSFDYQQQWENQSILWATTGSGTLIGMTYDMQQEVFAWHSHSTGDDKGDKILGVSVIYGDDGADDEVWCSVLRYNQTRCTIERLWPVNWQTANAGNPDITQTMFCDCGTIAVSPATAAIPLPSPLPSNSLWQGRTVCASINGALAANNITPTALGGGLFAAVIPNYVPAPGDVVVVGFPINWALQPMRIDTVGGTPVSGLTKSIYQLWLRTLNSIGGHWETEDGTQYDLPVYPITENSGDPPPYNSGVPMDVELPVGTASQMATDPQITVYGNDPLPMTILGLTLKIDVTGKP